MAEQTIWTKEEFKAELNRTYAELKEYGWTKAQCKKEVEKTMRENNIILETKRRK